MATKSTLTAGLKALAQPEPPPRAAPEVKAKAKTVLIGANFHPDVARSLLLVQADRRNQGKTKKMLLAEAINDLCEKYGVPAVANLEE